MPETGKAGMIGEILPKMGRLPKVGRRIASTTMLTESKTNQEEDQALKLVLYSAGIALLSGASLMGIIAGALLSVPLVTASLFLAEEFYVKRQDNNSNQVAGSTCAEHQAKEPALSQHQLEQSTAEESS